MAKKVLSNGNVSWSKDDIESLVRQGPKGDVLGGLDCLRKWVLLDGVDADGDGMVCSNDRPSRGCGGLTERDLFRPDEKSQNESNVQFKKLTLHVHTIVSTSNLHLVDPPKRSTPSNRLLSLPDPPRCLPRLLQDPK